VPNPDVAWNQAEWNQAEWNQQAEPNQAGSPGDGRWRRFTASLPMRTALLAVAAVWLLGAVWSFTEQSAFAGNKGFSYPHLLPLVIDGFAVAMAGVAWAASLDARPAVAARLATVIAVAASSASNGAWAYLRTNHDLTAVVLGVAVPIAANLAFEVLLAEMRRQVQRRRGLPPPVAIPYPRLIRLGLAPFRTFVEWRALVLDLTAMDLAVARAPGTATAGAAAAGVTAPGTAESPEPATASVGREPTRRGTRPEPVRHEPVRRETAAREAAAREPVGIERVRRELAQYSDIARQEPAWSEPGGHRSTASRPLVSESLVSGPLVSESLISESLVSESAASGPAAHEPIAHEAAAPGPGPHRPDVHETAHHQPVPHEAAPQAHASVSHEPALHERAPHGATVHEESARTALARDGVDAGRRARSTGFEREAQPAGQPTRLAQAAPDRSAAARPVAASARPVDGGRSGRGQAAPAATQNGHSPARRRDLEAVPAAAPARLSAAQPAARTNNARRTVDPRVELLAAHLASTEDAGEFTGEMVGPLLNIDVAPRTGRRLLGLARELVNERARSETDPRDDELSAAIGSG